MTYQSPQSSWCKEFWYNTVNFKDDAHMTSMQIFQFLRHPFPLSIYVQNSSTLLTLDVQFQTNPSPTPTRSPNDNQSIKRKHNQRMIIILLYVTRSFLQVGFCLQYQLINGVWRSLDFFSFTWSLTTCFFVALYSCVCCCPKISGNVFYL